MTYWYIQRRHHHIQLQEPDLENQHQPLIEEAASSNNSSANNSLVALDNPGYGFNLPVNPIPLVDFRMASGIRGIQEESEPESLWSSPNRSGLTDSAVSSASIPESGQDSSNLTDPESAEHPPSGSGEDSVDLTGSVIEAPPQESGEGPVVEAGPAPTNWRREFQPRNAREVAILRTRYILNPRNK